MSRRTRPLTTLRLLLATLLTVGLTGLAVPSATAADTTTTTFTGRVDAVGTAWVAHDWAVDPTGQLTLSLDWVDTSANLNLYLKDPSGAIVASSVSPSDHPETISFAATVTGTYKVGVRANSGASDYSVTATRPASPPPPPPPTPTGLKETFTGRVDATGVLWVAHDWTVDPPGDVTLSLDWVDTSANLNLYLKDPSGAIVASSVSPSDHPEVIRYTTTAPGTYKIGVRAMSGASDYTVTTYRPTPPPPPTPTGKKETFVGRVDAAGLAWVAHDWTVDPAGDVTLSLDWVDPAANLNLYLKDSSGAVVASAVSATSKPEEIRFTTTAPGPYKIGVKASSGASDYTVTTYRPTPSGPPPVTDPGKYVSAFGFRGHAGQYPYGMDYDATDNTVLVADIWNYRVLRYTTSGQYVGIVSKHADEGQLGGIADPFDVEADPQGNVWVANQAQSRVVQFDHNGNFLQTIGLGGGPGPERSYPRGCGNGAMYWPTHLLVHPTTGDVYVTDPYCRTVHVYTNAGVFKFDFAINISDVGVYQPNVRGIDIDARGNIYVVELNSRRVIRFDAAGNRTGLSAAQTDMNDPRGMAVDSARGLLYVVGAFYNEVFKFQISDGPEGVTFVKKWSGPTGTTKYDSIRFPTVDGDGNVYVGDTWAYRVYKSDQNGNALPWATGPQPPPNGGYNQNNGIGIDPVNKTLYVVDTFEQRAQRFGLKKADGSSSRCLSATDCPAFQLAWGSRSSPQPNKPVFNYPRGLTFAGNFVFMESSKAVARYTRDGAFVDRWGEAGTAPGQFTSGPRGWRPSPTRATRTTAWSGPPTRAAAGCRSSPSTAPCSTRWAPAGTAWTR